MIIVFKDSGVLTCERIEIADSGKTIFADDIYEVDTADIEYIADDGLIEY